MDNLAKVYIQTNIPTHKRKPLTAVTTGVTKIDITVDHCTSMQKHMKNQICLISISKKEGWPFLTRLFFAEKISWYLLFHKSQHTTYLIICQIKICFPFLLLITKPLTAENVLWLSNAIVHIPPPIQT